jgi:hypothetical protein
VKPDGQTKLLVLALPEPWPKTSERSNPLVEKKSGGRPVYTSMPILSVERSEKRKKRSWTD